MLVYHDAQLNFTEARHQCVAKNGDLATASDVSALNGTVYTALASNPEYEFLILFIVATAHSLLTAPCFCSQK